LRAGYHALPPANTQKPALGARLIAISYRPISSLNRSVFPIAAWDSFIDFRMISILIGASIILWLRLRNDCG
jgi:hypothetical protein